MKTLITYFRRNVVLVLLSCVWVNATAVVTNFPFIESFEASSTTLADWSQVMEVGTAEWTFVNGSNGGGISDAYVGTRNARFIGNGDLGFRTKLVSPPLNLSDIVLPKLSFFLGQQVWKSKQNTTRLFYRTSVSSPWIQLEYYTQSMDDWTGFELTLPEASATYQIAFEAINHFGRPIVIDLVKVYDPSTGIHSPEAADAMLVYMDVDLLNLVNVSQAPASIQVYNLVGELVMLGETNGNTHTSLNVSTLVNGIYVVCVVQDNGVMLSRKVSIYR